MRGRRRLSQGCHSEMGGPVLDRPLRRWIGGGILFWLCGSSGTAEPTIQGCDPVLIQTLRSPLGLSGDGFGQAVAMSDEHVATLAPLVVPDGLVYVFSRTKDASPTWMLDQEIRIDSSFPGMLQGSRLAIDGSTLAVGVPQDSQLGFIAGAVYVFQRSSSSSPPWKLVQVLLAPDGKHGDFFGAGVALDGNRLVVGAPWESSFGASSGAAYCFERSPDATDSWVFRQKLQPVSLKATFAFGATIAIRGDTLAIGAPNSDAGVLDGGAVYLYQAGVDGWEESQVVTAPDIEAKDSFGGGIALSRNWLLASSPLDDDLGMEAGAVHVFRRESGRWMHHQKLLAEDGKALDSFGAYLAMDGDTSYVGTPFVDFAGLDAGAAYTYALDRASTSWIQASRFLPPDLEDNDTLAPVAARGGFAVAGATKSSKPGAVYVFSARPAQDVTSYCTSTSGGISGCVPDLMTLGAPSASQGSTFRIWSRNVPGARFGVVLFSPGGPARVDLVAGGLCIPSEGLRRKGLFFSGGSFGACDGTFELDWNEFIDDRDPETDLLRTPGAIVHLQVAWIDPLTFGAPAWSDALTIQLCP